MSFLCSDNSCNIQLCTCVCKLCTCAYVYMIKLTILYSVYIHVTTHTYKFTCVPLQGKIRQYFLHFYDERSYVGIESNCSTLGLSNSIEIAMYHNS